MEEIGGDDEYQTYNLTGQVPVWVLTVAFANYELLTTNYCFSATSTLKGG
jgi:hypothetical protein